MVEISEFFRREAAFTPETIQVLVAALDEAWERLRQSRSPLARPAYSRAMREVVAKRIIEIAQRGVQDREALKQFPAYLNRWDSQQARNEGVFAH